MPFRVAILDDYQLASHASQHWRNLPPEVEVVTYGRHLAGAELLRELATFDAVFRFRERTAFPAEVLEALPRLKLILATGNRNADSIDLNAARRRGVTVCSTRSQASPTLELAWSLILALVRRTEAEAASVRAGGWQSGVGGDLAGGVLGIVGLGRFGRPMVGIARAFGMEVIAWSPNLTPERAEQAGATAVDKRELFERADVVTLHMPEAPDTIGIVSAADIGRMKRTACLVNTSRAPLVDEQALIRALRDGAIAGAGLDVFDEEPLPADHPFRHLPNVIATPHIGYVSRRNYETFFQQAVENLTAFLDGRPIRTLAPEPS